MLRMTLAIAIILMPNLLYLKFGTAIPGLNPANLLLVLLIGALALSDRDKAPATTGIMTSPLLLWVATLTIGFAIAIITSPMGFVDDLTHLKNLVFFPLLYFVYRRCGLDLTWTRRLIHLSMAVAVFAGLDAAIDALSFDTSQYSDAQRSAGPFGGVNASNRAGVFYAMFLPLLLATALFNRDRPKLRLAALLGCAILAIGIMATFSRQAYLIAIVISALLLLRRSVLLAAMLALIAIPTAALLPDAVSERIAGTQQYDAVGAVQLDSSTASRFEIWSGAWKMWKDHPLGVGINRFPHYLGDYSSTHESRDAHNAFVLMLAECGLLGVAAMLWLLWRLLKLGLAIREVTLPDDHESRALYVGFMGATLAMALGNVYGTPFFDGLVMGNFWALCGLIEHYVALKADAAPAPAPDTAEASDPRVIGACFPLSARALPGRYASGERFAERHMPGRQHTPS
nr:O-antigen ligase family protein [Lysobacter chinensis]